MAKDRENHPIRAGDELHFEKLLFASLSAHRNSQFDLAETGYREILSRFPGHAGANDLFGTLLHQTGRPREAEMHLERALSLDPGLASASNSLGAVRFQQNRKADAVRAFAQANMSNPANVDAWLNRSRLAEQMGDLDQAFSTAYEAVQRFPDLAAVYARAGAALLSRREPDQAIGYLEKAIERAPLEIEPYLHLSLARKQAGDAGRSQAILRSAILLAPDAVVLYPHLRDGEGQSDCPIDLAGWASRAICLSPRSAGLWALLAAAFEARKDDKRTASAARRSMLLEPDAHAAHHCLALALFRMDEFSAAARASRLALLLFPDISELRFVAAACAFISGDTAAGWRLYEDRVGSRLDTRRVGLPELWDGQSDPGHLLVAAEQGVGDEYIFLSRLSWLRDRVSEITVECDRRNRRLFERSFPDFRFIDRQISATEREAPVFDYRAACRELDFDRAILSASLLPLSKLNPQEVGPRAFLLPEANEIQRWRTYFSELTDLSLVGICWRGGTSSTARDRFYCDAEAMLAVLGPRQALFVNLVYNSLPGELEAAGAKLGCIVHDPVGIDQKDELDRLAALLAVLDVVVAVDTAVCTLSAAVGTPTLRLGRSLMFQSDHHDAVLGASLPMCSRAEPFDLPTCLSRAAARLSDILSSEQ
ncbi:tetratricopeptide repeat protein [Nisaea acidiphila]|uniref:Tetratricopeptide repeat protein n=1 Tax=Nisaea acidiphila TaxID=1862145 RepID=A0A9J7AYJ1_9PROT|nr:tetratricopeptide repeat protein [Nisaea acidiphila]UUX50501.1 tetratricopeptide repeat protein [Nisaea acidiphila]